MSPKIFVTGGAGYVGGDFLALLQQERTTYQVRALVRSEKQASLLNSQFPNVKCVYTASSLHDLLVAEGKAADVVVQIANSDDEAMSFALLNGVSQNPSGAYIHVSGIASLIDPSITPGQLDSRVFSDAAQTNELLHLPRDRLHTAIEQDIIAKAEVTHTKVAIVSLPRMYGKGQGHISPQSKIIEPYLQGTQSRQKAFVLGAGDNISGQAHVRDSTSALLFVVDEALKGSNSTASWGRNGYYFVEAGEGSFTDFAKVVAREMHGQGFIPSADIDNIGEEEIAKIWEWGPKFWGSNSRCRADRLRALGWRPSGVQEQETIGETIQYVLGTVISNK